MKKVVLCFVFLILSGFRPYSYEEIPLESLLQTKDRLFLLTEPKSGTHWTIYILQYFTHRATSGQLAVHGSLYNHKFSFDKPFIHAFHSYKTIDYKQFLFAKPNINQDKLIIIIRNPKESCLRGTESLFDVINSFKNRKEKDHFELFENLNYLESWPDENRYVFYYEDLMKNPREEISKLLDFIGESEENVDSFIQDMDFHRNQCISFYNSELDGSYTRGEKEFFHSKNYTKEELMLIDHFLKTSYPYLWNKYLKRYEEKAN